MDALRRILRLRPRVVAAIILVALGFGLWLAAERVGVLTSPNWGPLAVVRTEQQPAARASGIVRIEEGCVVHDWTGGLRALLLWPSDRVSWLAAERAIRFRNLDGSLHLIRDGDAMVLRGGGGVPAPDGRPIQERFPAIRASDWVVVPDAACPMDQYWLVADVEVE